MEQYRLCQAARTCSQPGQEYTGGGHGRAACEYAGDGLRAVGCEPVGAQGFEGGADVPDAKDTTRHQDRGAFWHRPAQSCLKHAAERGFLPQDGADWNADQSLVSDRALVEDRDPLVVQDRAGGRHHGEEEPPRGDPARQPGSEPPMPPGDAIKPQVRGRQTARRGRRQRGTGGTEVEQDVAAVVPRMPADHVVIRTEGSACRDRETYVAWPGMQGSAAGMDEA